MGYGLWILDELTTKVNGRMHIYSEGAYYYREVLLINILIFRYIILS